MKVKLSKQVESAGVMCWQVASSSIIVYCSLLYGCGNEMPFMCW